VESNDSSSEVPFDTVRSPAGVYEVSNLKHTRTSVLVSANEHTIGVVAELEAIYQLWEAVNFGQISSVDSMEVVATIETARRAGFGEGTVLEGITVGLCGKVPDTSVRINDTGSRNTDSGVDVDATIKIGSQKRYVHVSRGNDISSLRIDLVEVVLRSGNVHILNAVAQSIDERLRVDLFSTNALEIAGQCSFPELAKRITSNDRRVHVVITIRVSVSIHDYRVRYKSPDV
jgi:hypothetical protein